MVGGYRAQVADPRDKSGGLSDLSAKYLGKPLDKAEQLGNWNVRPLHDDQVRPHVHRHLFQRGSGLARYASGSCCSRASWRSLTSCFAAAAVTPGGVRGTGRLCMRGALRPARGLLPRLGEGHQGHDR